MTTQTSSTDTIDAFSRLSWHDAELLGWRVAPGSADQPVVTFDVVFSDSGEVSGRTEVRFNDVRGFYTDVDLLAKALCGDQIASGYCKKAEDASEAFVQKIDARFDLYRGETVNGLFLFGIQLIHPAGEILVIARSFSLIQGA